MKDQRHKRKESFSVLVVSNTDRSSRQFQISLFAIRLVVFVVFVFLVVLGVLIFQYSTARGRQESLRKELLAQQQTAQALEKEKESWNNEKMALTSENETLRQIIEQKEASPGETEEGTQEEEKDKTHPSRYPSQGSGVMEAGYGEDHPYLTISTYAGSSIVAAGNGTIVTVSSDDTYKHIIEIQHESGYTTRYLCQQEADVKVEEGAQVQLGDVLLEITADETKMDYQILYEGETVDPMTVIEARG